MDRQRLVESLFLEAVELGARERAEFLAQRCAADPSLRAEVESLLGAHEGDEGVLDEPQPMTMGLMKQLSGLLKVDDAAMPPTGKIGAYRVIRVLGSGGMGVVYLAEQERPKRTVALKVIRRGLATASLLRRFEHEAEILGRLHHVGIAQIYEAGLADDGFGPQPYIAMEYIDGRPLTEHAAIEKLGVREKLVLMVRVCDAVQHAHQRGVIHRDVKPGNILVQREAPQEGTKGDSSGTSLGLSGLSVAGLGQPKILDFGVARIADDRAEGANFTTMGTNVGQLIGTLAYMSPEQLGGDTNDVDTRSDVYALGVVLYQLLTGRLPLDVGRLPIPEAVRMIKEDIPPRLGSVSRELRGDLETIVSKSIEKERGRRYQSAAELGADIQRFLLGEPIAAKRDSAVYVMRKQMARYKSAVGAGAIAVIALVAFAVYAAMSAERFKALAASEKMASESARMEKERADANAKRLQQELFVSNVERGRLEGVSGKVVLAEEFLWSEYFRDPESPHARWGLWELYERFPCRWTVQGLDRTMCAAVSTDGKLCAVGGGTKALTVVETGSGAVVARVKDLPANVMAVAYEPNGEHVVVGLANGMACVIRPGSEEPPMYLRDPQNAHQGAVRSATWSRDGRFIATGGQDRKIRVWDGHTLARLTAWEAHPQGVCALAFDAPAERLASGSYHEGPDARIKLWKVADGAPIGELPCYDSIVASVAFSPDGKHLASAVYDRFALLHDLEKMTTQYLPNKFSGGGSSVEFSPDGDRIIGSGGTETRIWTTENPHELITLAQHRAQIMRAAWTGAGRAVSVSYDGAIKGWELKRALPMRGVGRFKSWCFGTAYSSDGKLMAIGSGDGTVVIADADTRERVHDVATGKDRRTRPLKFLPGDTELLAGCDDGMVRVIDVAAGTEKRRFGAANQEIFAIALQPGADRIATAHADFCVRLWKLSTGTLERELRDRRFIFRVEGVAFSPDGKTLACSGPERGVLLWDTDNWEAKALLQGNAHAWCVAFSPDGRMLAAGTWGDNVELWEMSTRLQVGSLTGHRGLISTVAFSPDGQYIASGGDDATVKLWHVKSRRCVLTLDTYHGEATGLSFHPSGNRLTTGCQDHFSATWDLTAMDPFIAGNRDYHKARFDAAAAGSR